MSTKAKLVVLAIAAFSFARAGIIVYGETPGVSVVDHASLVEPPSASVDWMISEGSGYTKPPTFAAAVYDSAAQWYSQLVYGEAGSAKAEVPFEKVLEILSRGRGVASDR